MIDGKMRKINKFIKKCLGVAIFLLCAGGIINYMLSEPKEYRDNAFKIQVISQFINSANNREECRIPQLPIDNPEIMRFYHKIEPLNCGSDDWIQCTGSICAIKDDVRREKGEISCTFTDIIRINDYSIQTGQKKTTSDIYKLVDSDFASVNCKAANNENWQGLAIGIRENIQRKLKTHKQEHLNVLIFGFDSLSRNAFIRKLPKSYYYLKNVLNTSVLNGYNIVGDGTPQALIPILTGHNELELPETRKRISNSNYVNTYPMIWKLFEKNNYVTAFNEDIPSLGTFTYRLNGFKEQPTDHYMRTFYMQNSNSLDYCVGGKGSHQVMMEYTKNFMMKYDGVPRFVFSFHGELSHDSINAIGNADDDLKNWLESLDEQKILENTILIIMSDHGNRFADVRNTLQGKQEERLPFFSFTFPEIFKKRFPKAYENFMKNTYRLTTPFDIHETLVDLLNLQNSITEPVNRMASRSISLFKEIPSDRSCSNAYIETHWCSCLNWVNMGDTNTKLAWNLAEHIINVINEYTLSEREICEKLSVVKVNSWLKLMPHKELLQFKHNKDYDGYLADLTSNMKVDYDIYQISITAEPSKAIYEASIKHNLVNNSLDVRISEISRINKYGSQANCIYDKNPDLRKYCYCKL